MSIQWITIATVGPFSVKFGYLALCGVILFALLSRPVIQATISLVQRNALWVVPYAFYLPILALALYGSPGHTMAPRQILYLVGAIAFGGFLAAEPRTGSLLRVGAGLGIVLFVLVVEVMAREIGLSWTIAIPHFLSTGDVDFMTYSFFRAVFNALSPDGEISVVASQINSIAVCIFVASVLFRAGYVRRSFDWLGMGMTVVVLFLIVLLNTRSVLIVAGASVLLATVLRSATNKNEGMAIRIAKITGAMSAVILGTIAIAIDHPILGSMSDRFAFEDASTGARVAQYTWALQQIDGSLLFGSGYAKPFGHVIHNLFLGAWVHAGLIAFLLVATFYLTIAIGWLYILWRVIQRPSRWVLPMPFEWVAVLPILPLFRVWLAGDAGHPFLGEWIAIATFFGLVLRNRLHLERLATSPEWSPQPGWTAARPAYRAKATMARIDT